MIAAAWGHCGEFFFHAFAFESRNREQVPQAVGADMYDAKQPLPAAIRKWHEIVRTGDRVALDALLALHVVFESPVVHTPQCGKAITAKYLSAAMTVLGGAEFRYVAQWIGIKSAVLEFVTIVDGIEINGVDMIGWAADEQIDRFKVMVRPLKAIQVLHLKMAAALSR